MHAAPAPEAFPRIGTVQNPALHFDGGDLLLAYEIAPADGGGIAILTFTGIIELALTPFNSHGLHKAPLPAEPWSFTEISGSDRTTRWPHPTPRLWTIAFNDVLVEVMFETVHQSHRTPPGPPLHAAPHAALTASLGTASS